METPSRKSELPRHHVAERGRTPTMDDFSDDSEAREFVDACLEGSYNAYGTKRWWNRPRTQLAGMTPSDAWQTMPDAVLLLAHELLY